jgi:RHS repeat-associated protein
VFVPKAAEVFTHDHDGNQTADGRWNYVWDAENRLVRMTARTAVGPQQRLEFEYDHRSRRTGKKVWNNTAGTGTPTVDQHFIYDGWNLLAILNSDLSLPTSFSWELDLSGSEQGAGGVGGLLWVNDASTLNGQPSTHFYAMDGNGNVSALVNAADGTASANYEYGPFAELLRATGPMAEANPFQFSTKYRDAETGLLYYGYRYYIPSTGRWPSRDPIEEEGGRNLFGFVGNSPISSWDLIGLTQDDDPPGLYFYNTENPLFSKEDCKGQCGVRKNGQGQALNPEKIVPACAKTGWITFLKCKCKGGSKWKLDIWVYATCEINYATPSLPVKYSPTLDQALVHERCHCEDAKSILQTIYGEIARRGDFSTSGECESKAAEIDASIAKRYQQLRPADPHADAKYSRGGRCYATGDFTK